VELARGIEPPTCGLQKPIDSNLPEWKGIDEQGKRHDQNDE
jgi:hypothetical protein